MWRTWQLDVPRPRGRTPGSAGSPPLPHTRRPAPGCWRWGRVRAFYLPLEQDAFVCAAAGAEGGGSCEHGLLCPGRGVSNQRPPLCLPPAAKFRRWREEAGARPPPSHRVKHPRHPPTRPSPAAPEGSAGLSGCIVSCRGEAGGLGDPTRALLGTASVGTSSAPTAGEWAGGRPGPHHSAGPGPPRTLPLPRAPHEARGCHAAEPRLCGPPGRCRPLHGLCHTRARVGGDGGPGDSQGAPPPPPGTAPDCRGLQAESGPTGRVHALPAGQHLGHFLHREAGSVRADYGIGVLWGALSSCQRGKSFPTSA